MIHANRIKPTRRLVQGRLGDEYVVEVYHDIIRLRPKGSRSPRVRVDLEWGQLYIRGITAQLDAEKRAKKATRTRSAR